MFVWMDTSVVPDHTTHVIARCDDYFFGLVHSRVHEVWLLAQGACMGAGNDRRYSSSKTFETLPFPLAAGPGAVDHRVSRHRRRAPSWRRAHLAA